jgi:hypothetical protein
MRGIDNASRCDAATSCGICSHDFEPARKSNGGRRPDGDLFGDGYRDGPLELPVAKRRDGDRGSDRIQLHHAGDDNIGQWLAV